MLVSKELLALHIGTWLWTERGLLYILDKNDPNFQLSGGLLVPILTIVSFDQDLDMAVLECNNGFISNNEVAFFLLRIISKSNVQTSMLYSTIQH